jgi:hypothetical protein
MVTQTNSSQESARKIACYEIVNKLNCKGGTDFAQNSLSVWLWQGYNGLGKMGIKSSTEPNSVAHRVIGAFISNL